MTHQPINEAELLEDILKGTRNEARHGRKTRGGDSDKPSYTFGEAKAALESYIAQECTNRAIKELEMLPVMRKGLHTPQKELDIILVDTVRQRIKTLQATVNKNGGEDE